jgi:hypothetical protein
MNRRRSDWVPFFAIKLCHGISYRWFLSEANLGLSMPEAAFSASQKIPWAPAGAGVMPWESGRETPRHSRMGRTRRSGGGEPGCKLADDLDITIDAELRLIPEIAGQI